MAATMDIEISQKVIPTGSLGSRFPPAANAIDGSKIVKAAKAADFIIVIRTLPKNFVLERPTFLNTNFILIKLVPPEHTMYKN